MADLSSLFRVAPGTAAYMTGKQQQSEMMTARSERERLAQLIQQMQIANEQSRAMNPLKLQEQQLANDTTAAQLPGVHAQSLTRGYEAAENGATLPKRIEVANSNRDATISSNQDKGRERIGRMFGEWGALLENEPEVTRGVRFAELVKESGDNPLSRQFYETFKQVPAAKLPEALQAMAAKMLKMNPKYQQAVDVENLRGGYRLGAAEAAGEYSLRRQGMANEGAAARAAARANSQGGRDEIAKIKNPYDRYSALVDASTKAREEGDERAAMIYEARAASIYPQAKEALRARMAGKVDMGAATGGKVPNAEPGDFRTPKNGGTPQPKPGQRIRVRSKDGKVGTIPAEQLQQALKQGFTKVD